jgi:translation initiation factor IF-2
MAEMESKRPDVVSDEVMALLGGAEQNEVGREGEATIDGRGVLAVGRAEGDVAQSESNEEADSAETVQTAAIGKLKFEAQNESTAADSVTADKAGASGDVATRSWSRRVALSTSPPSDEGAEAQSEQPHGRLSRPMIAAAGIVGVVLVASGIIIANLVSNNGNDPSSDSQAAASFKDPGGLPPGFVPNTAALDPALGDGVSAAAVPSSAVPAVGANPADPLGAGPAGAPAGQQPAQQGQQAQQAAPPAAPLANRAQVAAAAPAFTGIAGLSCTGSGVFQTIGKYTSGSTGFVDHSSGGYTGDGCSGGYESVPMSGDAGTDDGNSVVWHFGPPSVRSCQVWVYIPNSTSIQDVGGNPAYYTVHSAYSPSSGNQVGSFDLNQTAHLGQWVSVGSFVVNSGKISLELHTRGQDWAGSTKTNAHLAAAQVKTSCYT